MSAPTSSLCPSFDVSASNLPYTLRLPSYRSSHLVRFHPYSERQSKVISQDLLAIEDHHDIDFDGFYSEALYQFVVPEENEEVTSLRTVLQDMEGQHSPFRGRIGLVELVIDFTLAMRRQSVKQKAKVVEQTQSAAKPQL
ncbi:hypothetical protein BV22DRAFT_1000670 [Leucogyrophana mollusca]|uniref:Uncharacterized protein n=1 Tax=Leucogyrophana mollusca TaxID=85980 RepID=A0ACB8C0I4_9AGAM|nr:hypothetical protein BV22DRAFT_1000670 [Leucogyrophana mollusca]